MSDVQDLTGQKLHLEHSYDVVEVIQRGPMTTLYAAEWHPLGIPVVVRSWQRLVSLKLRHKAVQRVLQQSRSAAALIRGPGLPDIVDLGEEHPMRPFLVMRLPPGALLEESLESAGTALSDEACLRMVRSVATALHAYREAGLIHRGPTVDRVWAGDDGSFTLLGAGEVLYRDDTVTMGGVPTTRLVRHIPPESFTASARAGEAPGPARLNTGHLQGSTLEDSPRAEVYAMGCLAYHALAGFHPFFVHSADTSGGVRDTMHGAPLELENRAPDSLVARTIFRAMARDPDQRFETPLAFADALAQALTAEQAAGAAAPAPADGVWYAGDGDEEDPARQPPLPDPATTRAIQLESDRDAYRRATRIWQFASIVLTLLIVGLVGWERLQPVSVVITTDPPAVELAERIGPVVEYRGRSPVVLRQRQRNSPIELQVVGPDGAFGEAQRFTPATSPGFQDLGRCMRLPLHLEFPHEE